LDSVEQSRAPERKSFTSGKAKILHIFVEIVPSSINFLGKQGIECTRGVACYVHTPQAGDKERHELRKGGTMKRTSIGTLLVIASGYLLCFSAAKVARADSMTYTLTDNIQSGCSGSTSSLCSGPFGTVTLTSAGSNVNVSETLNPDYYFIHTGAGDSLEFNASGTVVGLPSDFSLVSSSPVTASGLGSFTQGISCTGCGNGASKVPYTPQTLSFTVDGATLSSFTANSDGNYFASDIADYDPTDKKVIATGNVGGMGSAPVVPEPASLLLFGTGAAFLVVARRFVA
jgi:hypothetical protein